MLDLIFVFWSKCRIIEGFLFVKNHTKVPWSKHSIVHFELPLSGGFEGGVDFGSGGMV